MHTSIFGSCTKILLSGYFFLLIFDSAVAQKTKPTNVFTRSWEVEMNFGPTQYWGYLGSKDLGSTLNHEPTWGYGLVVTRNISPWVAVRAQYLMGKIKGRRNEFNDGQPANLLYFSDFVEGNIMAKFNLNNLFNGYNPDRKFGFYGMAGLGLSNFQGQTSNMETGEIVNLYGHGHGKGIRHYELEGVAMAGLGLSVKLIKQLDFRFENTLKFINTNKLNEKTGSLKYDAYGYSSIGLAYIFNFNKAKAVVPLAEKKAAVPVQPETPPIQPVEEKKEFVVVPPKDTIKPTPKLEEPVMQPEVKKELVKQDESKVLYSGFKVQILATHTPVPFNRIQQKYKLMEQIREDHLDGWYRYSVGEFKTLGEAMIYRKKIRIKNHATDAFVVKFLDGKRVGPVWK